MLQSTQYHTLSAAYFPAKCISTLQRLASRLQKKGLYKFLKVMKESLIHAAPFR